MHTGVGRRGFVAHGRTARNSFIAIHLAMPMGKATRASTRTRTQHGTRARQLRTRGHTRRRQLTRRRHGTRRTQLTTRGTRTRGTTRRGALTSALSRAGVAASCRLSLHTGLLH